MFGDGRHCWYHKHRVIDRNLGALPQCGIRIAMVNVVDPQHICEENRVELSAFKQFCQLKPVFEILVRVGAIAWMSPKPRRQMADAVHIERVEPNLFFHDLSSAWSLCDLVPSQQSSRAELSASLRMKYKFVQDMLRADFDRCRTF